MKRKSNQFLLLLIISSCLALFSGRQLKAQSLGYDYFIGSVQARHPIAIKATNLGAIGKYEERGAKGAFDPQVNAGYDNKFFSGSNYYNTAIAELKQGVFSGQSIKAGFEYGGGSFVNPEETTKGELLPYIGLELSLLQGMMIDKRRYELLKGARYKQLFETEGAMVMNELLHDAAESYVEWLRDVALAEINGRYVETATQRFNALKSLSAIGERPNIDTVEAAILIQSRKMDYGYSQMSLVKALNQMNYFMLRPDSSLVINAMVPGYPISEMEERCLSAFLKMQTFDAIGNPMLKYYANKGGLLEVERKYKAEQVKPRLDLRYNLLGNTTQATTFYTNNYKWGAGFSMPLFLRNPTNDLKIAKLNLRNNEIERQSKSAELKTKLNALKNMLSILAEQIQVAKQTLSYSRLLLDAEKIKFDNNESSLFLLNTREGKVLDSEIKLVDLQAKFVAIYFDLVYTEGGMKYTIE